MADGGGRRQSGLGIASFVVAIVGGVTVFVLIVIAGVMAASTSDGMDEESPQAILLGVGLLASVMINVFGILLGVAGLGQSDRVRTFAVLGLVLNLLVILGFVGLVVLGLSMGG